MADEATDLRLQLHRRVQGLGPSPTLAINELCGQLEAQGRDIVRFGFGQSPFPVPDEVVAALQHHAAEKDYLPVQGLPALCEAVAEHHGRREGLPLSGSQVVIGPGSKELMFLLQMVLDAQVLLPSPCWVSYAPQSHLLAQAVRYLPTRFENRWRITPQDIARACAAGGKPQQARLLILNSPGNPDGLAYSKEELAALADEARRQKLLVLSDEIYGLVHHTDEHVSMARYYPEGTIISSGISKWCGAGGWRLGTLVFPRQLMPIKDALCAVASETFSSVSAPIQYAAMAAFGQSPTIERYLADSRRILAGVCHRVASALQASAVRLHPGQGGFYLFPDFERHRGALRQVGAVCSRTLAERLLVDAGVALLPGAQFGQSDEHLTARLAYVNFDGAKALLAAGNFDLSTPLNDEFFTSYTADTLRGAEQISSWLRSIS